MNGSAGSLGVGEERPVRGSPPGAASGTITGRILRGAVLVGVTTLLVKLIAFAKEITVASIYGRGDDLEAFLIALVLPSLVAGIVGGAFHQAFLPIYVRVKRAEGEAVADRLFRQSVAAALLVLVGVGMLLYFAGPRLLASIAAGYEADKLQLAVNTLRRLTPVCLLGSLPLMLATVLHARERFVLVSLAQVAVPGLTLVFLVWRGGSLGIQPLIAGVLVGLVLEVFVLWFASRRLGHLLVGGLGARLPESREVIAQWLPAVGGLVFQQATTLVDQAMAAHLVAGSVAALSYAYRLIALPLSLATLSIGTAILPVLSDLAGRDDWGGFWRNAARWIRLSLWGGLAPAAALFLVATPLVELAYERGSFGSSDTAVVGAVLGAYTGMIPFYVAGIVGVRAFSILGLNRLLLTLGAVNLVTNVAGNLILARWFGVVGIALATVAVYLISAMLILARLNRERRRARIGG